MNPMETLLDAFKALTETNSTETQRLLEEEGYDVNALVPKVAFFIDELRAEAKLRLAISAMPLGQVKALSLVSYKLHKGLDQANQHDNQQLFMLLTDFTTYHYTYPALVVEILKLKLVTQ